MKQLLAVSLVLMIAGAGCTRTGTVFRKKVGNDYTELRYSDTTFFSKSQSKGQAQVQFDGATGELSLIDLDGNSQLDATGDRAAIESIGGLLIRGLVATQGVALPAAAVVPESSGTLTINGVRYRRIK